MLNQNRNAVYFVDVYNCFSDENKITFNILFKEAINNCSNTNIKNFFSGINIENNELKISNFDKSLYDIFFNNLKLIQKSFQSGSDLQKYSVKVLNANFNVVEAYNSRLPFLYILNFINEYADKNKVNDFIKKADIVEEISDKLFNINLTKLIMDDNTLFYNIYIDETGNLDNPNEKIFAVGGYYVKNIEHKVWYEKCSLKLEDLEKKYFTEDNKYYYDEKFRKFRKIYHRNKIDKDKKGIITTDAFNFLKENDAKFICIYEEKPSNVEFTRKYYVDLVSNLIVKTINQIIEDNRIIDLYKQKIKLNIKIAARTYKDKYKTITYKYKDIVYFLNKFQNSSNILQEFENQKNQYTDNSRYMEKIDIEPYVKEVIEKLSIKYGISSSNIDYEVLDLTQASKEADLVFADYFCNLFYHHDEMIEDENSLELKESDDKKLYNRFKDMVYKEIEYSSFHDDIDFYFIKRDYYSILDKYIFYKKVVSYYDIGYYKKDHAQVYVDKILNFSKNDSHGKRGRYIIAGLKSLLEKIEYESNSIKNYKDILFTYDSLIEFIKEIQLYDNIDYNEKIKKALIFMINTEKLAVFNHSENHICAYKIVKENENYIDDISSIYEFRDRVILFDMLKYVSLWHVYDFNSSINVLTNIEMLESENANLFRTELGKLYGILGQSYTYNYYITNDEENLKLAEKALFKSIEYLSYDNNEIIREYSYLMNLYIIWKKEDHFFEILNKYLDLLLKEKTDKDIFDKVIANLNSSNKDKNYDFFVIRLLKYCNTFNTEKSNELSKILIKNESGILYKTDKLEDETVDILKEYNLLYYRNKNLNKGYLKKCFKFLNNKEGYFDNLRKLSIYMIEILMNNNGNIDNSVKIMKYLSEESEYYKKVFIDFIDNFNFYTDKKEWALKIRNKLYM